MSLTQGFGTDLRTSFLGTLKLNFAKNYISLAMPALSSLEMGNGPKLASNGTEKSQLNHIEIKVLIVMGYCISYLVGCLKDVS